MGFFELHSRIDAPLQDVFAWHTRPGALRRLLPPWLDVRILEEEGRADVGVQVLVSVGVGPLRLSWRSERTEYEEDCLFVERQLEGPFEEWLHQHRFDAGRDGSCIVHDRVTYRPPLEGLLEGVADPALHRFLHRFFEFRHSRLRRDIGRHARFADRDRLRVVLSGASGLVGRQLDSFLTTGGHRVQRLVRRRPRPEADEIFWDPIRGDIDADALEGADAFIHLAGGNVGSGRWSPQRRRVIEDSRIDGTALLSRTLAGLERRPGVLLSASAVGYYGDRGGEVLGEDSPAGTGFLANVCRAWEDATGPAADAGVRVANLRIGVVLTAGGGALARMLWPARLGLGGPLGSGEQYLSWIAIDDLVGVFHQALFDPAIAGKVNVVAPEPVTSAEFARTLGRVLRRPARLPVSAPVIRVLLGEMGEALLLASARVAPRRLEAAGFPFQFPSLESALRFELWRP